MKNSIWFWIVFLSTQSAQAIPLRDARILFIGETHTDRPAKSKYAAYFKSVRALDERFDCLTFEIPRDFQIHSTFDLSLEELTAQSRIAYEKIGLSLTLGQMQDWGFQEWLSARDAFIQSGGKAYLIDVDSSIVINRSYDPTNKYNIIERSRAMAEQIRNLLESGLCQKVIAVNGAVHLFSPYRRMPSMPDNLSDIPSVIMQGNQLTLNPDD